jgi:hypothetical protein
MPRDAHAKSAASPWGIRIGVTREKGQGGEAKLVATENKSISNLEPMAWTRGRVACDRIGHKEHPIEQ